MKDKSILQLLLVLLAFSLLLNIYYLFMGGWHHMGFGHPHSPVSTIALAHSAQEEIACPCCDKNIAECTCGMAGSMRGTVDQMTNELFEKDPYALTQEAVLLAAGKEFGMDAIMNSELRTRLKARLIASAPADRPKIAITPEKYDFGEVSVDNGVYEKSFELKNNGTQPLVIKGMTSSCGCTSAKIVYKGEESPVFGMHDKPNWTGSVAPGDSAELVVMYDPGVHPDFKGDATRTVTVMTNDPIDSKKEVTITLTQK